jgi:hypothetical protein
MSVTINRPEGKQYETVAAGQTAQVLGTVGAVGDVLDRIVIIPATTAAGNISILDNATSISVFVAGTLADLSPITIDFGGIKSASGAWKVTTGANVSVIAVGRFS